ncbi:hypothetical protein [Flavihumibacter sp. CACIAM 22H1]|uniref:hypothetical protein n=1 Tax=Flavihumibacter sp. CACIAM 22H1 TaxID=1812911 RepID=UPI0007A90E0A|nr:hypothetical protein [Flavihumibacter sp. CACIAM 22H1]KYP16242.1 MAG: hypothetical protein A1D16_20055 [Flavihumibacter sp. CACIAM 22H1]
MNLSIIRFGVEFSDGQYLASESDSYTDEKYEGFDVIKQFRPVPPPPPVPTGTIIKGFKGANNYYVGTLPFNQAGSLGDELTEQLTTIAKKLMHPDSKIETVTISVTQVIGSETTTAEAVEAVEARRQVNIAIVNMINLLKGKTKNKAIKFVNGRATVIQADKTPNQVSDSGTKIKFDK